MSFKFDDDIFTSTPKFSEKDIQELYDKYLSDMEKDRKSRFIPKVTILTKDNNRLTE